MRRATRLVLLIGVACLGSGGCRRHTSDAMKPAVVSGTIRFEDVRQEWIDAFAYYQPGPQRVRVHLFARHLTPRERADWRRQPALIEATVDEPRLTVEFKLQEGGAAMRVDALQWITLETRNIGGRTGQYAWPLTAREGSPEEAGLRLLRGEAEAGGTLTFAMEGTTEQAVNVLGGQRVSAEWRISCACHIFAVP